jgi:uncharacterized membrane protein
VNIDPERRLTDPGAFANWAAVALTALIALCLLWELWLAPLRPGGSWLVLKVIPLLAPLPGTLRGHRRTFQWSSMLILAYVAEGIVRAMTEHGSARLLAALEIVLALFFFCAAVAFARATQRNPRT